MLRARNISFSYPGGKPFHFPDIEVPDGGHLLVLGESGAGKTTLLHLIAGLLKPSEGEIYLNSTQLGTLNARQLDRFRGQHIGIVFQKPHFVRALNVLENLLLLQHLAGQQRNDTRAEEVLTNLGLHDKRKRKPHTLSEGEQQRVAIAMAVLNKPQLLLADEPTASLDDTNCQRVLNLLKAEAEKAGAHLLIITHDQRVKAAFNQHIEL